jgi:hypothetical protein
MRRWERWLLLERMSRGLKLAIEFVRITLNSVAIVSIVDVAKPSSARTFKLMA